MEEAGDFRHSRLQPRLVRLVQSHEDCCQYFPIRGRQGGGWIERFIEANDSQHLVDSELVILGTKSEDMQMAEKYGNISTVLFSISYKLL